MAQEYVGTIMNNQVDGSFWEFRTPDGRRFHLRSEDKDLLIEGKLVRLSGSIDESNVTDEMIGPYFDVESWRNYK